MSTFPKVGASFKEEGYTPLNIEESLLRLVRVYTKLIEMEGFDETKEITANRVLSYARSAMLQQNI